MADQPNPEANTIAHQDASPFVKHLIEKYGPKTGSAHDEKRFVLSVARLQEENAKDNPTRSR